MQKAAGRAKKEIWHISFKGVLDMIVASQESMKHYAYTPQKRKQALQEIIQICGTKIIDIRPDRTEPRAIKRRSKNFQLLTSHRSIFQGISHRSRYRKFA